MSHLEFVKAAIVKIKSNIRFCKRNGSFAVVTYSSVTIRKQIDNNARFVVNVILA